ncbi:MAG: hypothetical protein P1P89_02410 [Desulfobacterales bacterium]|nr:hypothetical protein [Desulfobacterales bacterium]
MPVEIIYKNRRQGADRRKSLSTDQVPERRSGLDRRKLDEKLKQLIESDLKDQSKERQAPTPTSSGLVILRKKDDGDKGLAD